MASEWVKLTKHNGGEVYVNLAIACSIEREKNHTTIRFLAGQDDAVVKVVEAPPQVFAAWRKVQHPDGS